MASLGSWSPAGARVRDPSRAHSYQFRSPLLTQQGTFRCVALSEAMGQEATFLGSIEHLIGPHHQRHRDVDT